MDLKQLHLLVDLVEAGSISKVCATRGIAQSALSKQIAALEKDFAARLFYRTGRGVVPTEFGVAIMPRVRALLAEAELLRDEIRARAGVPSGPVRLAMQASITLALAGPLFSRLKREFAQIELRLMEGFSGSIEEWLANGRADVGVLARYGTHLSRMDEALATHELYLVGPHGDALTAWPDFRFHELARAPLVLPGVPDGLRMMLAEVARKHAVPLDVSLEVDSLTAMKEIVASRAGYTILSRQAVANEVAAQRLQVSRIVEPVLTRTLVLATSAQRPLTSAARTVANLIREFTRATPGPEPEPAPSPASRAAGRRQRA